VDLTLGGTFEWLTRARDDIGEINVQPVKVFSLETS